jgi:hypothetical protein
MVWRFRRSFLRGLVFAKRFLLFWPLAEDVEGYDRISSRVRKITSARGADMLISFVLVAFTPRALLTYGNRLCLLGNFSQVR